MLFEYKYITLDTDVLLDDRTLGTGIGLEADGAEGVVVDTESEGLAGEGRLSTMKVGRAAHRGMSYSASAGTLPTAVDCTDVADSPFGRNPNIFWIISCASYKQRFIIIIIVGWHAFFVDGPISRNSLLNNIQMQDGLYIWESPQANPTFRNY